MWLVGGAGHDDDGHASGATAGGVTDREGGRQGRSSGEPSRGVVPGSRVIRAATVLGLVILLNRPGMSGDSELWEGWSPARQHEQALPG